MLLTFLFFENKELKNKNIVKNMEPNENLITQARLYTDLKNLGISKGDTIMLHVSLRNIGWLVGSPDILIKSIQEIIGLKGNLIMYTGWEDSPYTMRDWSEEKKSLYQKHAVGYNPDTARATVEFSLLAEVFRNSPNVKRSMHPDGSFCAWGKDAEWIVSEHSYMYGYGDKSPLRKFLDLNGKIAMVGAPLGTATFLHYVETVANIPNKRVIQYSMPVAEDNGKVEWVDIEEYDTERGIVNYNGDYFEDCIKEYISKKNILGNRVGLAPSFLFHSGDLFLFAKEWMEALL